jgi:hypothetical protein
MPSPPGQIKSLVLEAETSDGTIKERLVLRDKSELETAEALQHVLSTLFTTFDITIVPVAHQAYPQSP